MPSRTMLAVLLVLAAGRAASTDRPQTGPGATDRVARARVAAVVVTVVMLEKGMTGQPPLRRPEWESHARDALAQVLLPQLARRGLTVRLVEVPGEKQDEVGDVAGILMALGACPLQADLGALMNGWTRRACTPVPPGRRALPGVGSLAGLASDVGADTVVFLAAIGTNSSAALSFFGWVVPHASPVSRDALALAVLAPDGTIDWLRLSSSATSDLREPTSAAALVAELLEGIPFLPPVEARP
jgi:hypothetical protein